MICHFLGEATFSRNKHLRRHLLWAIASAAVCDLWSMLEEKKGIGRTGVREHALRSVGLLTRETTRCTFCFPVSTSVCPASEYSFLRCLRFPRLIANARFNVLCPFPPRSNVVACVERVLCVSDISAEGSAGLRKTVCHFVTRHADRSG